MQVEGDAEQAVQGAVQGTQMPVVALRNEPEGHCATHWVPHR